MWNHDRVKQVNTIVKLNERKPDKYCWADLYLMAVETDSEERLSYKNQAKLHVSHCKEESKEIGRCWCGKFTNGVCENERN